MIRHKKTKDIEPVVAQDNKMQKVSSQWIPVSRKKRKNQKVEEEIKDDLDVTNTKTSTEVIVESSHDDEFESYDVNQLVDVVPIDKVPKEEEEVVAIIQVAEKIEIISSDLPEKAAEKIDAINHISKEENVEKEVIAEESKEQSVESENKTKKNKNKKGTHKPTTKRVIITDVDLSPLSLKDISHNNNDDKPNANNTAKTIESTSNNNNIDKTESTIQVVTKNDPSVTNENKSSSSTYEQSSSEKKSKNKKKNKKAKPTPTTPLSPSLPSASLSTSETTITNNEDYSYDSLLENTLLNESDDKTNIEVSQELDKIIQKGMYSNLEEKIKSINVDMSDGFFQTILTNISRSRESSVEKSGFIKTPDFTKLLSSKHLFKSSAGATCLLPQKRDFF